MQDEFGHDNVSNKNISKLETKVLNNLKKLLNGEWCAKMTDEFRNRNALLLLCGVKENKRMIECLNILLSFNETNVNYIDNYNNTAIHSASERGNYNIIKERNPLGLRPQGRNNKEF